MKLKAIEKLNSSLILSLALATTLPAFAARAQTAATPKQETAPEIVATGGAFALEKTVTAGGGGGKAAAAFSENGTTGQSSAGVRSTGGQFSLYAGFWTPDNFIPTAASAVVGGRVLTPSGAGIRNVQITIAFPSGELRTTTSSAFGYYRFAEIPVGAVYVITVSARKYTFSQPSQIRQVMDDLQDVDFVADPF